MIPSTHILYMFNSKTSLFSLYLQAPSKLWKQVMAQNWENANQNFTEIKPFVRYSSAEWRCCCALTIRKWAPVNTEARQGTGSDGEFKETSKTKSEIADLQINL